MNPEPLFGLSRVVCPVVSVEAICVTGYPESATRPPMWEGFNIAYARIGEAAKLAEIWISGEFVVDVEDPDLTLVNLFIKDPVLTPEVDELLSYVNHQTTTDQLACSFSGLIQPPESNPNYQRILKAKDKLEKLFAKNGADGVKGYPVVEI